MTAHLSQKGSKGNRTAVGKLELDTFVKGITQPGDR